MLRHPTTTLIYAWLIATILSGLPSTLYAFITGSELLGATLAAGAMLFPEETSTAKLVLAAAIVHPAVSLFWACMLGLVLPQRHPAPWSIAASALIAFLDLRIIAPAWFPQVAALEFWPQFADHLMWGLCFGLTLQLRSRALREPPPASIE